MFGLGLLGWVVGFVLLGIATFRAKVLAGWYGLLVAAYPLLLRVLLVTFGAGTLAGLVWLVLGYALWTGRDTVGERSSRVR
jgi:membrane protein implicated in regulation of membrane protease activity